MFMNDMHLDPRSKLEMTEITPENVAVCIKKLPSAGRTGRFSPAILAPLLGLSLHR